MRRAGPFVLRCLTPSGGFAPLETTWTAVETLRFIETGHDPVRLR